MCDVNSSKPRIIVLGGAGSIGRNFVKYCVDSNLCSYIRVADKTLPGIAYFSEAHNKAFADDRVEFVQADLTREAHVNRAFDPEKGPYDYVFNVAGETRCGLSESTYESKCRDLSINCATKASQMKVKAFVEVSTAFVYKSQSKGPAAETSELEPWTLQATYKLKAEEEIRQLPGLHAVFLRPVTVYGSGDFNGLMPRIICAASYVKLKEKMKLLWNGQMHVNTVHVQDVCQAMWHLSRHARSGAIYNLADKNDTDQNKLNLILEDLFDINTGFIGKIVSKLAGMKLSDVVKDVNGKHMRPWSDLCAEYSITHTPLTPYLDKELLQHKHLYVDGSAIERETDFRYSFPTLDIKEIRSALQEMIAQKIFPPILREYQDTNNLEVNQEA